MTPAQRKMARKSLGLPNVHCRNTRHGVSTAYGAFDHAVWLGMVHAGLATMREQPLQNDLQTVKFWLTPAAAQAALNPGETLDPEVSLH